jgi:type IV pilus assembly protein PilP
MKPSLKLNPEDLAKKFMVTLICFGLFACGGGDFSDLDQKIAEIKARPKGTIDPLPPVKTTEPFSFDLDGSRDPFKTVEKQAEPGTEEEDNGIRPDPNRVKEDLESQALDSLRMVGTLKDSTLWALVKSSNNTIYRVKVGNYMGLNDGKIIEISNDEIKLIEIVPDKNPDKEKDKPRWNEQPASLKLVATE